MAALHEVAPALSGQGEEAAVAARVVARCLKLSLQSIHFLDVRAVAAAVFAIVPASLDMLKLCGSQQMSCCWAVVPAMELAVHGC